MPNSFRLRLLLRSCCIRSKLPRFHLCWLLGLLLAKGHPAAAASVPPPWTTSRQRKGTGRQQPAPPTQPASRGGNGSPSDPETGNLEMEGIALRSSGTHKVTKREHSPCFSRSPWELKGCKRQKPTHPPLSLSSAGAAGSLGTPYRGPDDPGTH